MRIQSLNLLLFSALAFHVGRLQACDGQQIAAAPCDKINAGACDKNNKHNIVSEMTYSALAYS